MTTTIRPITPTRVMNFARILPLFTPAASGIMPSRRQGTLVPLSLRGRRTREASLWLARFEPNRAARLKPMETAKLSIPRVTGSLSQIVGRSALNSIGTADVSVPPGISQFTNVATLKRMLKARRSDVLLRKVGDGWEICPDTMKVDLADDSVEFRLGDIQVYS